MPQDRTTPAPPPLSGTLALMLRSDFGRLNPERAREIASRSAPQRSELPKTTSLAHSAPRPRDE
jgi:hypothetical protein